MMRLASLLSAGILAFLLPRSGFGQTVTDSFDDASRIDAATSSGHALVGGTLRSFSGVDLGTGADGACVVSDEIVEPSKNVDPPRTVNLSKGSCVGRAAADAVAFPVTTYVGAGQAKVTLASAPTGLAVGDEVLIINLWGNAATVGQYETRRIRKISSDTLTLDANLTNTYNGWISAVMVQRVPNYTSVSVSDGWTLTAKGFDRSLGGVLFFRVLDTVSVGGDIDMSERGYRGGHLVNPEWGGGYRGEGPDTTYDTLRTYTQSSGAGGGGDAEACHSGEGGGGGGYGTEGGAGSAQWNTCPWPVVEIWYFGRRRAEGGATFGTADLSKLILGPGGGSGGVDSIERKTGGIGGTGGGILVIAAETVSVTGGIRSHGAAGTNSAGDFGAGVGGGGGGGAGGSILLQAHTLSLGSNLVSTSGGRGGRSPEFAKHGGAGGAGRIAVRSLSVPSGSTSPIADLTPLLHSPATVTSTNLLAGIPDIGSIDTFTYSLRPLPAGSSASIQFSQDGQNWYDHSKHLNQSSALTAGMNQSLSLEKLGWHGSNFYYRVRLEPASTESPVLDAIAVVYCADANDTDGDGFGDACDADTDNDGVANKPDNCRDFPNADQADADGDKLGDVCDTDDDNDNESDTSDNCRWTRNADQLDTDGDGAGDACDVDDDNDAVADTADNCIRVANKDQKDTDADGIGDVCDSDADGDGLSLETEQTLGTNPLLADTDGDGIPDATEVGNPLAPNDTDGDGLIDALDEDADGDGVADLEENAGARPGTPLDSDEDGLPDYLDTDSDNDEVRDGSDNCHRVKNTDQADTDKDGTGDLCDADMDGDGLTNTAEERFSLDPRRADSEGDGIPDGEEFGDGSEPRDTDGDTRIDALDEDSDDDGIPDAEELGVPGKPVDTDQDGWPDYIDEDSDGDGREDGQDNCRLVSNAEQRDTDGDGKGDACDGDLDGDNVAGERDNCPSLANPDQLDTNGDGQGDACGSDDDGDGVADESDNCPLASNADQRDADKNGLGTACDPDERGGCGCSVGNGSAAGLAPMVGLLLLALRSRRSRFRAS